MKQRNLFVTPIIFLVVVAAAWTIYELRTKHQQAARYRLPDEQSPRVMLEFIRELDGSPESGQGPLDKFVKEDDQLAVVTAVLNASEHILPESSELTAEENREARFYKIKYTTSAIERGYLDGTPPEIEALESETRVFLECCKRIGRREAFVAFKLLLIFETKGGQSQRIAFVDWLVSHLGGLEPSHEVSVLTDRLQRIRHRWQLIGTPLELLSTTSSGEPFDLQSLRGKVVYIEFWSTSCQPCLAELPALQRIYQQYHGHGFEIVAVCIGAAPERIRRFVADRQLPWIQLCHELTAGSECNQQLSDDFGIEFVPTSLLLDASGTVVAQGIRPLHQDEHQNLERRLNSLLK